MTMVDQARLALESKSAAERDLSRLALCPPWRHAAFAASQAALVATPALLLPFRFVVLALVGTAIWMIVRSDRRRLGVFINGYRRGRTRLVTFPMLAIFLGLYLSSVHFGLTEHLPAVSLALSGVTFVVGYVGSMLWQRVFVHELGI